MLRLMNDPEVMAMVERAKFRAARSWPGRKGGRRRVRGRALGVVAGTLAAGRSRVEAGNMLMALRVARAPR